MVEAGVPFREAHHVVGAVVKLAEDQNTPLNELATADVQKIHRALKADWIKVFDLKRAGVRRNGTGMPGPKQVKRQLVRWQKRLA